MATRPRSTAPREVAYPARDGRPLGETPIHCDLLFATLFRLQRWFEPDPMAYVSGGMLLYYARGDRRRRVCPDAFVTLGIPNDGRRRDSYLLWEEGKGPDFVIEFTSKSTLREDRVEKFGLYRDILKVREYFLFDPYGDYLMPPLEGYRLVEGEYRPVAPIDGRLPSEVTGLHFEADGEEVRLIDPATGRHMPSPREVSDAFDREGRDLALRAEAERAEAERLRREVEELRRRLGGG